MLQSVLVSPEVLTRTATGNLQGVDSQPHVRLLKLQSLLVSIGVLTTFFVAIKVEVQTKLEAVRPSANEAGRGIVGSLVTGRLCEKGVSSEAAFNAGFSWPASWLTGFSWPASWLLFVHSGTCLSDFMRSNKKHVNKNGF